MNKTLTCYDGVLSFDEKEHAYTWGDKFVPGVTSILKILDKPALVQWAANMAAEYIRDNLVSFDQFEQVCKEAKTAHRKASKSAADIGSEVHAFCEAALIKQRIPLPVDPQARKGADAFLSWLHAHEVQPIGVERMVFSKLWYYAGTTDFVGRINGERCILDFKTSSGLYLEMLLQLAAYAIAVEEELKCERINHGWIIRLDKKTGKCEPYKIELKDSYRDAFLRVREAHELISKMDGDLEELRASARAA